MDIPLPLLMRWYRAHGRHALPWRRTRSAYAIFVSELMLQQTQVDRVRDFYARWMKTFPEWEALARAKTDALIRAWAGLGYNRRVLYAREAARIVVKNGVPRTAEAWRTLPGMGPYASAAVFGFTQRTFVPAVDTNVRRAVGRAVLGIPYPTAKADEKVKKALEKAAGIKAPWTLTYALMDLGALVCTSRRPQCAACPFADLCRARQKIETAKAFNTRPRTVKNERRHAAKPHPDRIYRGRILSLIRREGCTRACDIGSRVDETFERARDAAWMNAIVARLVRERFLERKRDLIKLSHV